MKRPLATIYFQSIFHAVALSGVMLPSSNANANALEEVIVTAQRREQSLQDVPVAVTAYNQEAIDDRIIISTADIGLATPGLTVASGFGSINPTIRGIGADRDSASGEPGVALYLDDIYMGRPFLPQVALAQIERIEVLKGPQGTLYGRNTSGGALKIVTKSPSEDYEISLSATSGSFDEKVYKASISVPAAEWLRFRLSGYEEHSEGYTNNVTTGEKMDGTDVESVLLSVASDPFSWLSIDIKADNSEQFILGPSPHTTVPLTFSFLDDGRLAAPFEPYSSVINGLLSTTNAFDYALQSLELDKGRGRRSNDPRETTINSETFTEIESKGYSLKIGSQWRDIDIKLITGSRESFRNAPVDADITDGDYINFEKVITEGDQTSAELHFSSDFEVPILGGNLLWLVGLYKYEEVAKEDWSVRILPLQAIFGADNTTFDGESIESAIFLQGESPTQITWDYELETQSDALFLDLEWALLDWLTLHTGARHTTDRKILNRRRITHPDPNGSCETNQPIKDEYSETTLKFGADVFFNEDVMLYLTSSDGFKAGGFNGLSCDNELYKPEYVDTVELGLKSRFSDNSVQINAAVFEYDYTEIQIEKTIELSTVVTNAAEASVRGAELEIVYLPFSFLNIDFSVSYLDAKYLEYKDDDPFTQFDNSEVDLSGNPLNKAPMWSGLVGGRLSHIFKSGDEIGLRVEASYSDDIHYSPFEQDFLVQERFIVWNVFSDFRMPSNGLVLRAYVKNATDEVYAAGIFTPSAIVGGPAVYYSKPRTVGVEISWNGIW